jgi:hypothetical protein
MRRFLLMIDRFLRAEDAAGIREQLPLIVVGGMLYGVIMGSYRGLDSDGWKQMCLSGVKVPMLFFVAFLLCLPSFYVLNVLAGVGRDFGRVLRALLAFQSLAAVVLAALAPLTGLMNVSTGHYGFMVFWSGVMFAVASVVGQWRMGRLYRVLIAANHRHRPLWWTWMLLYWFVAIQMAWVLRPFVGDPTKPFQLLRAEAWGNAYVEVAHLVARVAAR